MNPLYTAKYQGFGRCSPETGPPKLQQKIGGFQASTSNDWKIQVKGKDPTSRNESPSRNSYEGSLYDTNPKKMHYCKGNPPKIIIQFAPQMGTVI